MFFSFYKRLFTFLIFLPIGAGGGSQKSKESSQGTQFQGIKDPFTLDAIRAIIGLQGVTPELKEQRDTRKEVGDAAGKAASNFSLDAVKEFSGGVINKFIRAQNEKNKPIISKAVEGAGVTSDAVSALLTNDLNTRTSEAAANLLASIGKDFGTVQAENLRTQAATSTIDTTGINALLQAIDSMKLSEGQQSSAGKSSGFDAKFSIFGG